MPCDTRLKRGQTISQRADEVRKAVEGLDKAIAMRAVKVVVGPQGAIAFQGWTNGRDDVTDACAFRRLMATGSALAKAEIARAEMLSGRKINMQAIGQGAHSHDGGRTWHNHKG